MPNLDKIDNPVLRAREERRQERLKGIRQSKAVPRVRVLPKNDAIRKHIYHPRTGARFPAQGSVEWPLDQFTKRRIRDKDVTIEEGRADAQRSGEHRRQGMRHEPSPRAE
jgi:hypothetical protein